MTAMKSRGLLRNFVFGAEDSLVSTVGLLSGISFAGLGARTIVVSGVILILVEAISMAAGTYLSEDSANEMTTNDSEKDNLRSDSVMMFFSYSLTGLIPLSPYMMIADTRTAFIWSVVGSLIGLFLVGLVKGLFVHRHPILSALKITGVGAIVIVISIWVGSLIKL